MSKSSMISYLVCYSVRPEAPFQEHVLQRLPLELRGIHRCTTHPTQHINSSTHRNCIRGSRFNDYILDLEKKYSPN